MGRGRVVEGGGGEQGEKIGECEGEVGGGGMGEEGEECITNKR